MSAHRTTRRPVLRAVLILLAAVLVLAGLYAFLRGRAAALAEGAAFGFDYTVTSTAAEPSPAYAVLEALDALSGSITGQTSGDSLYICWYSPPLAAFQTEQAPGPDQAFTDLYVKDGTVYLNVRQLYRSFLSGLIGVVTGLLSLVIFIFALIGLVHVAGGKDAGIPVLAHFADKAFGLVKTVTYTNPSQPQDPQNPQ